MESQKVLYCFAMFYEVEGGGEREGGFWGEDSTIFSPTVVTVKTKHLSFDALISNRQRISEIDIY